MPSGGYRPNAGRKKWKETVPIQIRVAPEEAEAIRAYAKEKNVTLAEAVAYVLNNQTETDL